MLYIIRILLTEYCIPVTKYFISMMSDNRSQYFKDEKNAVLPLVFMIPLINYASSVNIFFKEHQ